MGNTILNPFSKETEVHELNLVSGDVMIPLMMICFEGENEYRKNAKETDTMSGSIIQVFHDTERCFFRNVVFLAKQNNPRITHFIIRKKNS